MVRLLRFWGACLPERKSVFYTQCHTTFNLLEGIIKFSNFRYRILMFASRTINFQKIEEQPVGRNPDWWTFRIYEAHEHDPDIISRSMVPSSMRKDEIFISRFLDFLNLTRTSIRTSSCQVFKASRVLTFELFFHLSWNSERGFWSSFGLRTSCSGTTIKATFTFCKFWNRDWRRTVYRATFAPALSQKKLRARAVPPALFPFVFNFGFSGVPSGKLSPCTQSLRH